MEKRVIHRFAIAATLILLWSCSTQRTESTSDNTLATVPDLALDLTTLTKADTVIPFQERTFPDSTLEASQLTNETVRRGGDSLIFPLKNGRIHTVINRAGDGDGEGFENYVFVKSFDNISQWLIFGTYYEAFDYILVDQNDGTMVHIWGPPVISPDEKYFVCGMQDLMAGFVANGIQLWKIEKEKPIKMWEQELDGWGPEDFMWTKGKQMLIQRSTYDSAATELVKDLVIAKIVDK